MSEIGKIIEVISTLREKCPADIVRSDVSIIDNIKDELEEVRLALVNDDSENLAEELGDLLFTVLFLIDIEKDKYGINIDKIVSKLVNKMKFRHPYVYENPKQVTIDEANRIWEEKKAEERELKIIH